MIIDFHTHCFPDALAPRAMESLSKNTSHNVAKISAHTDGTARGSKEILSAAGINGAVVCNIATNAKQEHKVNGFAVELSQRTDGFFFPLGSLNPDSENVESELDFISAAGIKGVKLHPDYTGVLLSDGRFERIFSILEERGFFAVIHAGLDSVSPDLIHAEADVIADVVRRHPKLKLVAAHMGGMRRAEEVLEHLVGTGVYIDTSLSSVRPEEKELLYKIIKEHDEDKILFGTDTPWTDPRAELGFVLDAPISEKRREKILSKNALKLLGIEA